MADEANPVDFLPNHPPRTELEQLQAALEAGLITPALFALAKEKLLNASAPPPPEATPQPSRPTAPLAPQPNEASSGELPPLMSFFNETPPTPPPTPAAPPTPAPARVTPPPTLSQPEARPSSPSIYSAEPPPVAPAPRQPVPPTPKPSAPAVDFLGASATLTPPAPTPRPAPTPPANFIPSQPDVYSDLLATAAPTPPPPARPAPPVQPAAAPAPSRSVMPKVLLALGIVGLLLLIYWQVSGSHPDEQLTSPRLPANTEASVAPAATVPNSKKRSNKSGKSKKRKRKKDKTLVVNADSAVATPALTEARPKAKPSVAAAAKPTSPVKAASAPVVTEVPPLDAVPHAVPPAPEAGDTEAALKVRATMAGYYADMLAPPFTAARHFAPRVERLYIQQNLTPADIDDRFNRNFFPDNKKAVLQIEPGTLRVSAPAADGTCMATFVEDSYVYHPSRQLYQRMRAQVRARFDADFKIIYLRQERLLESTVE